MQRLLLALALIACAHEATAVNVVIDYSLDQSGFFSTSTPEGRTARGTVEFAAAYLSDLLGDNLARIESPPDFVSRPPFGNQSVTIDWEWTARFFDPATGSQRDLVDLVIAEDEYRLFVGARQLGTSVLGSAGPGVGFRSNAPSFFSNDQEEVLAIQNDFDARIANRLQADGDFGSWGGAAVFDVDSNWNLDYRVEPQRGENDFLSTVLHEFTHTLGFGIVEEYTSLISGNQFTGANAVAANGGTAPTLEPDGAHLLSNTQSPIFGTDILQEASLDPTITVGTRKLLTELDIAVLADLGWEIRLPGDYNDDGLVNTSDYAIWRDSLSTPNVIGDFAVWSEAFATSSSGTFLTSSAVSTAVPEPAAMALLALAAAAAATQRRQ